MMKDFWSVLRNMDRAIVGFVIVTAIAAVISIFF